jgi:hypothetical protein
VGCTFNFVGLTLVKYPVYVKEARKKSTILEILNVLPSKQNSAEITISEDALELMIRNSVGVA